MRMMPAVFLAISFALALTLLSASGVGPMLDQSPDTELEDSVNEAAEAQEDNEVDPDAGGDSLLGSTVAALATVTDVVGVIVFFPSALETIGAPAWFARVAGHGMQILVGLGIAQVIRGTEIL